MAPHQRHGMSRTTEWRIWWGMHQRCTNPDHSSACRYSERGISVCESWMTFANFFRDMGPRPSAKHSIERIDNNGDYEPKNCKWATRAEQQRNTRRNRNVTINGVTMCATQAAALVGMKPDTLLGRLQRGHDDERALNPEHIGKPQMIARKYRVNGASLTRFQIAERYGVNASTFFNRIRKGWPIERAIIPPSRNAA